MNVKKQTTFKGLDYTVVKAVASLARTITEDGVEGRCFGFLHQPTKPKDLEKRLRLLKGN